VVTAPKQAPDALGFSCQLSGSENNAADEDEWHFPTPSGTAYFAVAGEVPVTAARVVIQTPDQEPISVPVTNGWFITVTTHLVPSPYPVTYFDSSGRAIGRLSITSALATN